MEGTAVLRMPTPALGGARGLYGVLGQEVSEVVENAPGRFRLSDVSVSYGGSVAVADVNCVIQPRAVTALIGPSGCGKSTLLRCLNRMNDLVGNARVQGSLTLDDVDIYARTTDPVELRMRVGQVFQHPNPFPASIYDNVAYGPRLRGMRDRARLDALVEGSLRRAALWAEVKDKLRQSALSLSGGQQQRLCIARALATNPEVLLMDEPCSALDPVSTRQVEETIDGLKGSVTVVMVTHSMQQAARVSDYTLFMLRESMDEPAHLVESGPTRRLFTQPDDKRTQDYITGRFG